MSAMTKTARTAGLLYLAFMIVFIFSSIVRSKIIIVGNPIATFNNIMASEWLLRIGFVGEILSAVFFLSAAWALYALLKSVDKNLALLFVLLNLCGVAIECINTLNLFAVLLLTSGVDYFKAFQANQLHSLVTLFLDLYNNGFIISQAFFGAWLFPLGYLVFKSDFLPRALGVLLIIDGVGILIWFFQVFLLPSYPVIAYPSYVIGFIAEFSLSLWLLIKGVKEPQPRLIGAD